MTDVRRLKVRGCPTYLVKPDENTPLDNAALVVMRWDHKLDGTYFVCLLHSSRDCDCVKAVTDFRTHVEIDWD